jgi:hypothetical protein
LGVIAPSSTKKWNAPSKGPPQIDETVERTSDQKKTARLSFGEARGVARTLDVVA